MGWGSVELEPEVDQWLSGLTDDHFGHAAFYIDLLAERGVHLGEPYTRQLAGKLRELRFFVGRERWRLTYFIAEGRRVILLTVFSKRRPRERHEVDRAERAMRTCLAERHTAEENER